MRLAFISNYFNHHQKPLSDALSAAADGYRFIQTTAMESERETLGWGGGDTPPYVCSVDGSSEYSIIRQADAVIAGSAPEKLIRMAMHEGKVIFRYSERPLKDGNPIWKYPVRFIRWHRRNPKGRPIYMLCASAFTEGDYSRFGLFRGRCYKWGYFPETRRYNSVDALMSGKGQTEILWCGRFLALKHPDDVIRAALRLKLDGYDFHVRLIGTGAMEETLKAMIAEHGLENEVELLGAMPPDDVRRYMEHTGIYLFTSDRREGWGAVLNEAMNSGCAVIAASEIGAAPFLVKNGRNGLIYRSGDVDGLYENIKRLLDEPEEQRRLGEAAYHTITDIWNSEVAARRLLALSQAIMDGDASPELFEDGPCSRAETVSGDWYKE